MSRHWDIGAGGAGFLAVVNLAGVNEICAVIIGGMTIALLGLRLRREWCNRNVKPKE